MTAWTRGRRTGGTCGDKVRPRAGAAARQAAFIGGALLMLAGGLATAGGTAVGAAEARQERLQQRMAQFREAFTKADVAVLEPMLAPNYTHTNDRSAPLDRASWLATMTNRRAAGESGGSTISEFTTSNVTLNVSGDTAVGTGTTIMRGTRNGEPYGMRINFTQVWAWIGDDWYRVAFHDTYQPLKD